MQFFQVKPGSQNSLIIYLFKRVFSDSKWISKGLLIANLISDLLTNMREENLYIFTAKENQKIIGSILFSKVSFDESKIKCYLLSSIAVDTGFQKKGVGKELLKFADGELKKDGVELLLTYGDINFYGKSDYQKISENKIKTCLPLNYSEGWLRQSLNQNQVPPTPKKSYCMKALDNNIYW